MKNTTLFLILGFFCVFVDHCGSASNDDAEEDAEDADDSEDAEDGASYEIGGTIDGLSGTVVLQNNAEDDLTLTEDGEFAFSTLIADGDDYAVTVLTQPDDQTCSITNSTGTIAGADVTNVTIVCSSDTYSVGGTLSGLSGTVVLQNNAANDLTLTANGDFTFSTAVADGAGYQVTVKTQPSTQTCSVSSETGTIDGDDVTTVSVVCSTNTYTVGGTVSGLTGTVVLQNNSANNLSVTANGSFTFTTAVADGAAYVVAVLTNPTSPSLTCTVANGSGTISGANVTSVTVTCRNKVIWVTNSTTDGSIGSGGVAGADTMCSNTSDANHPNNGGSYKALIVDGANRIACTTDDCGGGASEHTDWVLAASTPYVRSNGSTAIGTTNSIGLFASALTNSISTTEGFTWTGLFATWTSASDDCTNWTNGGLGGSGERGDQDATLIAEVISTVVDLCSNTYRIYCVEQ